MKEVEDLKIEEVKMAKNQEVEIIENEEVQAGREYLIFNELIAKYQDGEEEALGEIIHRVEPLIAKRCRYYFGYADEDLMQDGRMRCIILIRRYNQNFIGVKFLGYLNRMLSCYFWDLKKAELKKAKYEYQIADEGSRSMNKMPYEESGYAEVELLDLIEGLGEKEKYIVKENILSGKKLIDTARELGISYEYSKDIKKSALAKLRKTLVR
ncbi:MAG: sigma-70 family RNA polymerase sigma factor [Proteocatella sp.]